MANRWIRPKPRSVAAAVVLAAVIVLVLDQSSFLSSFESFEPRPNGAGGPSRRALKSDASVRGGRRARHLQTDAGARGEAGEVHPWARDNLRGLARASLRRLSAADGPSKENFLFWHIPKSGGTAAKEFYKCAGKIIDVQSMPLKIRRAKQAGLVESGIVDIVFSSRPNIAIQYLYNPENQGTVMAMFRHPVDRLVSKFYYLRTAVWEKNYSPKWKDMDILEWVKSVNIDNNHMVKKLAGKRQRDTATETDLLMAKSTIRQKFIVGLMDHMEESLHRFNKIMGVNEEDKRTRGCMAAYFGKYAKKKNSSSYAKVEEGSDVWNLLAKKNHLDIKLYAYVVYLFYEQKEIIDSYTVPVERVED